MDFDTRRLPITLTQRTVFDDEQQRQVTQLTLRKVWPMQAPDPPSPSSTRLVVKPKGEVGRPGRNGYSLSVVLGWEKSIYLKVQVCSRLLLELALILHSIRLKYEPKSMQFLREDCRSTSKTLRS